MTRMLPILAVFAVASATLLVGYSTFQVKTFEIETDKNCVSTQQVQEALKKANPNLLTISQSTLSDSLKSKYSCIGDISYEKKIPSTLGVSIVSNAPLAKIDGTSFAVDANLVVVQQGSHTSLPTIYPSKQLALQQGQKVEESTILFALEIARNLKDSDFILSNIRIIDSSNIIAYNSEDAIAVFSSKVDLSVQLHSLQSVLAKSKIDATKIARIDLRYNMPVVVFK